MFYYKFLFLILISMLCGCAKQPFSFTPTTVFENKIVPPDIESSIPASIYRHDLNALTGQLAIVDDHGKITPVLKAVDPEKLPIVTAIPEEAGLIYNSIISSGGNSILKAVSVDANLSSEQKAEVIIRQQARSMLTDIPRDIVLEKAELVSPKANQKLVYITGTVLSLVKTTLLDEVSAGGTVTYGPVFGFNNKIYKASTQLLNSYVITLNTIDVESLKKRKLESVTVSNDVAKELTMPAPTAPKPLIITEVSVSPSENVIAPAQTTNVNAPVILPPPELTISPESSTKIQVSN
ncbi:hypothetical protein ACS016_12995 [Aeromonas veronii]|uniref:hypothetical protein n=1 Tax=Aeromonas veronii TaxID=654 RepID=UPI003F7C7131